jgi:REP element-mobilizing transposase RayT
MNPTGANPDSGPPGDAHGERPGHLPRLPREYYQGDAVVHWTLAAFDRAPGWLTDAFHARFRELMLHAATREGLFCPAYCLMPDHLHLVWMGLRRDTDQRNGMSFLRTYLEPVLAPARFQPQAHDSVLRERERQHDAFAKVCFYILANPVRAGLVGKLEDWRFGGTVIPGYPKLHPPEPGFWDKFWKLYGRALHPDSGKIKRPPF